MKEKKYEASVMTRLSSGYRGMMSYRVKNFF